jgi:hypothetical protein
MFFFKTFFLLISFLSVFKKRISVIIRESIVRTIAISVIYALIEAYFTLLKYGGNVISPYHLLVLLIGVITGYDSNLRIWIANILSFSVLEDIFYWTFKFQLPYQWGSEYIVIDHIPVYYIPYLVLALILYKKGSRKTF